MNHVEQSLQYAIYELQLAFLDLAIIITESLPKSLRFIHEYFNERHYDTQRSLAEYINEFIDDIKKASVTLNGSLCASLFDYKQTEV